MPEQQQVRILLIDDLETLVNALEEGLTASGYNVISATSGHNGLQLFEDNRVDIVLCDLAMPDMNGLQVAKQIERLCLEKGIERPPFLLLTALPDTVTGVNKLPESGIDAVLKKPVSLFDLLRALERGLSKPKNDV